MTTTEDRPTIGERYTSAIESGNLRLGERRGDVDMIIAAGLVPDGLGAALYRLQVEFDAVRAAHAAADLRMRNQERKARAQVGEDAAERSQAIRDDAEHEALTAHVLILSQLSTLHAAKAAFGRFAVVEATRRRLWKTDAQVMAIAGRVLDVFISPTCRHCGGRGFNGGGRHEQTGLQVLCRPCGGSGHRRDSIGQDDAERLFAGHLLMRTDALMHEVQKSIGAGLRLVDGVKQRIAEAAG